MRVEINKYIVADTEICHGKPTFKGTRVLVSDIVELVAAGVSSREIIKDYYPSLTEEMIKVALEWAAKIISGGHRVRYAEKSIKNGKLASLALQAKCVLLSRDRDFLNSVLFPPSQFSGIFEVVD